MTIVRTVSRMSPSVDVNVAAARSTSAGGGSSLTNRIASLRAMNRAVAGWRATMSRTSSPSSMPRPAASRWPSTSFASASWISGRKTKPEPWRGFIVQPVSARATSMTSLLRVPAVDAERVQLEQLARVVLVQAARSAGGAHARLSSVAQRRVRRVHRALELIQVEQHRRALRHGAQQVAEVAERARPDHVAVVGRDVEPR